MEPKEKEGTITRLAKPVRKGLLRLIFSRFFLIVLMLLVEILFLVTLYIWFTEKLPILLSLQIDPLFFGIIMVISLAIGHNTPPVGLCLFVACDIGGVKLERLVKEVAPLVLAMIAATFVMNCFPQVVLFLPNLLR